MAGKHVLDDGESQSGAAGFARAATIDPVEALGETLEYDVVQYLRRYRSR